MFTKQKWRMLVKGIIGLALAAVLCTGCHSNKPAELSFNSKYVDLGIIYSDSAVRHVDFKFRNIGGKELIVKDVKTDCDCTKAVFPHEAINSGGEGVISVTLDLRAFFPQRVVKHVAVYSNTGSNPDTLVIAGIIKNK